MGRNEKNYCRASATKMADNLSAIDELRSILFGEALDKLQQLELRSKLLNTEIQTELSQLKQKSRYTNLNWNKLMNILFGWEAKKSANRIFGHS